VELRTGGMLAHITRASTHYAVCLSGDLDLRDARFLRREGCALVCAGPACMLADLTDVRYFGCSGLNALLAILESAEGNGGFLYVTAMSATVQRVLDLTGTTKIVADREHALSVWPEAPI
jgi:anti-anti-sigma factor